MQEQLKFNPRQPRIDIGEERRTRNYQLTKTSSYAPGNWKNYIASEVSLSSDKRSSRSPSIQSINGIEPRPYDANLTKEDSRVKSILLIRRQEEKKRKQQVMRKVRQLHDKVLPMVRGHDDDNEQLALAWQSRMEQKIARLQTQIDCIKKEATIQLQKRVIKLEDKWDTKLSELYKNIEHLL